MRYVEKRSLMEYEEPGLTLASYSRRAKTKLTTAKTDTNKHTQTLAETRTSKHKHQLKHSQTQTSIKMLHNLTDSTSDTKKHF